MNELIETYKSNILEIRNFEKNDVPLAFLPDMTKKRGTIFLVNKHVDLELLFIKDGKLEIHLDNDVFYAESNNVVVVNSNILHNLIPLTDTTTYECLIIDKNFFDNHGLFLDNIHIKEVIKDDSLFDIMRNIKSLLTAHKTTYYIARVNACLLDLSIILFEKYAVPKEACSDSNHNLITIEKGIHYINKYFNKQITIDDVAVYAGYSKSHFCRCFKEITGYTVATYINMQKIKYARNMLTESNMNINEIAAECGFNSEAYFSTTFKKYTGTSPSALKKLKERTSRPRTISTDDQFL